MSFKNLLDLRRKPKPEVIVVEKLVLKPRSVISETLRITLVIAVVTTLVWGISNADELPVLDQILQQEQRPQSQSEDFSDGPFATAGIVSEKTETDITLNPATDKTGQEGNTYTISITNVKKIETNTYDKLTISDIQIGDKVVIQGTKSGNIMSANRIISFSPRYPDREGVYGVIEPTLSVESALPTATTTPEVATTTEDVATTTDETASTTEQTETSTTTENASSTPGIIETITDTIGDAINTAGEIITDVVDTLTGNNEEEPTQTEPTPDPETPSEPEQSTQPEEESTPTTEPTPEPASDSAPESSDAPAETPAETPSE